MIRKRESFIATVENAFWHAIEDLVPALLKRRPDGRYCLLIAGSFAFFSFGLIVGQGDPRLLVYPVATRVEMASEAFDMALAGMMIALPLAAYGYLLRAISFTKGRCD